MCFFFVLWWSFISGTLHPPWQFLLLIFLKIQLYNLVCNTIDIIMWSLSVFVGGGDPPTLTGKEQKQRPKRWILPFFVDLDPIPPKWTSPEVWGAALVPWLFNPVTGARGGPARLPQHLPPTLLSCSPPLSCPLPGFETLHQSPTYRPMKLHRRTRLCGARRPSNHTIPPWLWKKRTTVSTLIQ